MFAIGCVSFGASAVIAFFRGCAELQGDVARSSRDALSNMGVWTAVGDAPTAVRPDGYDRSLLRGASRQACTLPIGSRRLSCRSEPPG